MKLHLIEELDVNTDIDWWNENRKRLNKVISAFNDWQTKYRLDTFERDVVLARIEACRKYGNEHKFSDWQFDLLNEMENFINKRGRYCSNCCHQYTKCEDNEDFCWNCSDYSNWEDNKT